MQKRSIILFVVLFVAIVAGMFIFAYLKRQEMAVPTIPTVVTPATSTLPQVGRVDVKHYFSNGEHAFAGVVEMPTPCDLLNAEATVQKSLPEAIVINFTVTNNAETCAQMITPQRFMVKVGASPTATVRATWKGVPIDINVIPAAPGERPEDFEVFSKG